MKEEKKESTYKRCFASKNRFLALYTKQVFSEYFSKKAPARKSDINSRGFLYFLPDVSLFFCSDLLVDTWAAEKEFVWLD